MLESKEISLSRFDDPRVVAKNAISFLQQGSPRALLVSAHPIMPEAATEFALRCAYCMAKSQRVLFLSSDFHPAALAGYLIKKCVKGQSPRRRLFFAEVRGPSLDRVCEAIENTPSPIVVIDSLTCFDVELSDLEKLAQDANIAILATRAIT